MAEQRRCFCTDAKNEALFEGYFAMCKYSAVFSCCERYSNIQQYSVPPAVASCNRPQQTLRDLWPSMMPALRQQLRSSDPHTRASDMQHALYCHGVFTQEDSLSLNLVTFGFVMRKRGYSTCCTLHVNSVEHAAKKYGEWRLTPHILNLSTRWT